MSKKAKIYAALKRGERLTHLKALAYGTHRLAAYVHMLRKDGVTIVSDSKTDGNGTAFTEYHLA